MTPLSNESNKANVSPRDLLKLDLLILSSLALASCGLIKDNTNFESEPLSQDILDAAKYLEFPTSPFKHETCLGCAESSYFGPPESMYRVVKIPASSLVPVLSEIDKAIENKNALNARDSIYNTLSHFDSILKIQKMIPDPNRSGFFIPDNNDLILPGSLSQHINANAIFDIMAKNPQMFVATNETEQSIAQAVVYSAISDAQLELDVRTKLITQYVASDSQEIFMKYIRGSEINPFTVIADIPEHAPLDIFSDIHTANLYNPAIPKEDQLLLQAIAEQSGTGPCFFVPKATKEFKESLAEITKDGFLNIPKKPKIYVIEDEIGNAQMYVINDDQDPRAKGNHHFTMVHQSDITDPHTYVNFQRSDIGDTNSWTHLQGNDATIFLQIHELKADDALKIYQLIDDAQIRYAMVPNKAFGSPSFNTNDSANARITPMIVPRSELNLLNKACYLVGANDLDVMQPTRTIVREYGNFFTDVTDLVNAARTKHISHFSRVGFLTPSEYYFKLFKGIEEMGELKVHKMYEPEHPLLKQMSLDLLNEALKGVPLDELNWVIATQDVPIYTLEGTNLANYLNEVGKTFNFENFLADKHTVSPWIDPISNQVFLKRGEMLLASPRLMTFDKNDGTQQTYIILGLADRDDGGGFIHNTWNYAVSDKIKKAYVIKLEDALSKVMLIDDDNNFVKAMKNTLIIGAIASSIYLTLYSPMTIPISSAIVSMTISSRYKLLLASISRYFLQRASEWQRLILGY